ncbi:putative nucleotidyltransferase, ribonuclease H [Tanacetum coccineum]
MCEHSYRCWKLAAAVLAAVDAMLLQIREQKPHSFEKAVAPVDAENWISHMEKIFDVMDCNDAFKTRLAVYKFEGDALAWWKAYKQAKGGDAWVLTLTWAAFKELFFLQFFPRAEQERLKREYHSIRQRASENSTEYMQRFLRLAGFLGQAAGTAEEQAKNFCWGLHKSILDHVMCIQFTDVAQVADAARNLEILRDRDDYDRSERSDKRHKSGDRYHPYSQQGSHRSHGQSDDRQKNDRQGSDRQGGGGILVLDATKGTEGKFYVNHFRFKASTLLSIAVKVFWLPFIERTFDVSSIHDQTIPISKLLIAMAPIEDILFPRRFPHTVMVIMIFLVMPLVSSECSSVFMDLMNVFFMNFGQIRHRVIDDILVFSKSKKPSRSIFASLQILRQEKLYASFQVRILLSKGAFLGHIVITAGFVAGFLKIYLSPLTKAFMRKGKKFCIGTKEREKRFEELSSIWFLRLSYSPSGSGGFRFTGYFLRKPLSSLSKFGDTIFMAGRVIFLRSYGALNISATAAELNIVTERWKSGMIAGIKVEEEIIRDLERLDIELCVRGQSGFWASLRGTKLCVPEDPTLREALMTEAYSSPFSIHPGSTKMYHDLKQHFWWSGMKRDVATFVPKCLLCQQVKIEHQRASGLLQPLEIPIWKWDEISMDFVTGLPRTQRKHDAIWVVVDRLTKSAHFLPIRKDYPVSKIAEMFQQEIIRLHGTPLAIVSDRDPRFTSRFWKGLQKAWGTRLKFSTAFHPETDGQSERTIQTLEDMLRSCALEWAGNWDDYICLVEFAYNNSWHASIKCAPFEMLYGRKCRAPICWDQVGERILEGPEMIEVPNEKVAVAREKLKEAQTRQKSYADRHRRALEFQPGEHVFLKVSPTRGVRRFGIKGKLSPRFIGPFEILDRVGEVSYRLALPPQLSHVHNVFHVSLLRGYKYHPLHVVSYPFDQIREDLSYTEEPESILDRQDRVMRNKTIPFVKILWRNHPEREATWETEESIRTSYPHFLP